MFQRNFNIGEKKKGKKKSGRFVEKKINQQLEKQEIVCSKNEMKKQKTNQRILRKITSLE